MLGRADKVKRFLPTFPSPWKPAPLLLSATSRGVDVCWSGCPAQPRLGEGGRVLPRAGSAIWPDVSTACRNDGLRMTGRPGSEWSVDSSPGRPEDGDGPTRRLPVDGAPTVRMREQVRRLLVRAAGTCSLLDLESGDRQRQQPVSPRQTRRQAGLQHKFLVDAGVAVSEARRRQQAGPAVLRLDCASDRLADAPGGRPATLGLLGTTCALVSWSQGSSRQLCPVEARWPLLASRRRTSCGRLEIGRSPPTSTTLPAPPSPAALPLPPRPGQAARPDDGHPAPFPSPTRGQDRQQPPLGDRVRPSAAACSSLKRPTARLPPLSNLPDPTSPGPHPAHVGHVAARRLRGQPSVAAAGRAVVSPAQGEAQAVEGRLLQRALRRAPAAPPGSSGQHGADSRPPFPAPVPLSQEEVRLCPADLRVLVSSLYPALRLPESSRALTPYPPLRVCSQRAARPRLPVARHGARRQGPPRRRQPATQADQAQPGRGYPGCAGGRPWRRARGRQ